MTPDALRALATRVETEEPTEALRAAVLTAFGCEAEAGSAPDPLTSVDDAKAFQPEEWAVAVLEEEDARWYCSLKRKCHNAPPYGGIAPTEPRTRTAAALRAMAWEKENVR